MLSYISLALSCVLISNIVLTQFLGICPFLGMSKSKKTSFGMAVAVMSVTVLSAILTYGIYHLILKPLNIEFMKTVVFILVIAALVQLLELIIKKYFKHLYDAFGVYLPLITTNCVVLGVCISVINEGFNFLQTLSYSVFTTFGYGLVLFLFSAIREHLDSLPIPKPFKGVPIALVTAAFMAMAFSAFSGIVG